MDSYDYITDLDDFIDLLAELGTEPCALDVETTTFTPDTGEVRLAQFCNGTTWAVVDFGPPGSNWFKDAAPHMDDGRYIAFSSTFEKSWLAYAGTYPTVWDVGHLRRALEGGGHMSLKSLVQWELEIDMSKEMQASNWGADELTDEQLDYAALDALYTWQVWAKLKERADPAHMHCFNLLDGMTDGVMMMQDAGLLLDQDYHASLIASWQDLLAEREVKLRSLVSEEEVANFNSGKQWNDFFARVLPDAVLDVWPRTEKTGLLSSANKDLLNVAGAVGGTPLRDALVLIAERSTLTKYLNSFGDGLIDRAKLASDGRIHARYNIAAAITCRFSSSGPNLQQIPRDRDFFGERLSVRKSFIADEGNLLVSYDYSGIEMRVLALMSGDETLLHDVVHGDVHAAIGEYVLGRPLDKSVPEDYDIRQSMKAVNFGIIYGTTALGLAGRQGWSFAYAQGMLDYWSNRYPKAFALRKTALEEAESTQYLRMIDGGTIAMGKRPSPTRCANFPVQRAALSIMARAIIRHHETLTDKYTLDQAVMASTIHDALIDEARADIAEDVAALMARDMELGYWDVFPGAPIENLIEGGVGANWGELK